MHHFPNLVRLGIRDKVSLYSCDPSDFRSVIDLIALTEPTAVYNLSGQSSVALSFDQPTPTFSSIAVATLNILEAIRTLSSRIKFYNAASSECFGNTPPEGADESTPFRPRSPYAVAKSAAFWTVANYREAHGLFACSGILFNHESPLRPERFVTQKIIRMAGQISRGEAHGPLKLGNIEVCRDWGWAPEYIYAMWLIMQQPTPDDFVIATGTGATLREFAAEAFAAFGLNWQDHVLSVPELLRPTDVTFSIGRSKRAEERLRWKANIKMPEIVHRLVADEINDRAASF